MLYRCTDSTVTASRALHQAEGGAPVGVGDGEVYRGDAGDIVVVEIQRHGGR